MRVRVTRTIQAKPDKLRSVLDLSLQAASHAESKTNIRPEVFWSRSAPGTEVKVFMDFDSLAQYEQLFLEGLLFDGKYLTLAEKGAGMIQQAPHDELLVLMDKDDFFMNYKSSRGERPAGANLPRGSAPTGRYRLCRHVDARVGKLREFMKLAFGFMDDFEAAAHFRPELYCTRFIAGSIGGTKMFFDYDDCPMCEAIWLQQIGEWVQTEEMIVRAPSDEVYVRATQNDVAFDFRGGTGKSVKKRKG